MPDGPHCERLAGLRIGAVDQVRRGGRAPSEHRRHLHRRHGIRRHRTFWRQGLPDPAPRPHGGRRHEVHRLLRIHCSLLRFPGRAVDRLLPPPGRHRRSARPASQGGDQLRGSERSPRSASRRTTPPLASANGTSDIIRSSCPGSTVSTSTSACPIRTTCGRCIRPTRIFRRAR